MKRRKQNSLNVHCFFTIKNPSTGEYKSKASKFLAFAFEIDNENEFKQKLSDVKKLHPKARHHCFAYRIGLNEKIFRTTDDGEPSGTAGRPILGQIDSFGLTNVLIVVVRYFGGTKLGVPGLIAAYKGAAQDALQNAMIVERQIEFQYILRFDYSIVNDIVHFLKKNNVRILTQYFQDDCEIKISVECRNEALILNKLNSFPNIKIARDNK